MAQKKWWSYLQIWQTWQRADWWKQVTICSTRGTKNWSPVQEVKGGEMKVEGFIGLMQVNHLLLQQLMQILLQKYGDQKLAETPSKFATFFHVKHSDFRFVTWFMSILKLGLPLLSFEFFRTKTKTEVCWIISVSSKRNIKGNELCYRGKHVKETML